MFRFFRQIRQKLLVENRFSKYLLYAVGEILLVVIGILIALYLDDLKTENQNREKELAYLLRFQEEVQMNITELERVISDNKRLAIRVDSILDMAHGEMPIADLANFERITTQVMDYTIFHSTEATVEEIIGSGHLDLIEDPEIRIAMAIWKVELISLRSLETDSKKLFDQMGEYYRYHVPMHKTTLHGLFMTEEIQESLLSDSLFLNTVYMMAYPATYLYNEYNNLRVKLIALQEPLASEIERLENK